MLLLIFCIDIIVLLEGDAVAGWGLKGTSIGRDGPIDAVVVDCSYL